MVKKMIKTVVKIDICKSKKYAAAHEIFNPSIRSDALDKLLSVSQDCFPFADKEYPAGTFYKAEGDAVLYIVDKPSVALRGAIEFMQSWYHEGLQEYPECRVVLDRGHLDPIEVPGRQEVTGKSFENISVVEKQVGDGKVYLTQDVLDKCDPTMAKFSFFRSVSLGEEQVLHVYWVNFSNPRTVEDNSLIHALFVAHPKAAEARDRIFELFAVEYLMESAETGTMESLIAWGRKKGYSLPTTDQLRLLCESSGFVCEDSTGRLQFRSGAKEKVLMARQEYESAKQECVRTIASSITTETGRNGALDGINLHVLIDQYLCALFSELRIMANYFRATSDIFNTGPDQFARFDYILRRHLLEEQTPYFSIWHRGFITGLRQVCEKNNHYIAAVFHNVLATYYLNRSATVGSYQIDFLKEREIFLDTNVLYSWIVPSSHFHELTSYFMDRLPKLGVKVRVFPHTLQEYENALSFAAKNWDDKGPSEAVITRNPWLYQEYMSNPGKYLNNLNVCRQQFSLAKDTPISEENCEILKARLAECGLTFEDDWEKLPSQKVNELWLKLRNKMTSDWWSKEKYWEFITKDHPQSVKDHDMTCIDRLWSKAEDSKPDAFGPTVLFITVDSKLFRLRRDYQFIVSPGQFLEFILPYLFLSDIPLVEADGFPNQLLNAQLGTLLVQRPPELSEIVGAYFRNPDLAKQDAAHVFWGLSEDKATALNNDRFKKIVTEFGDSDRQGGPEIAAQAAVILSELHDEKRLIEEERRQETVKRADLLRRGEAREERVAQLEAKIDKLQKSVKYWRAQMRKGKS